jgi:NAD(P)-dependent dehydrogenase (short-subunit alcohol dehydrogenase family)
VAHFDPHPPRRPAIVTGASSGIGAAIALSLAECGHPVVLGARRTDPCEETAEQIRSRGGEAAVVELDLNSAESTTAFAEKALGLHPEIEILVSNAGAIEPRHLLDTEPEVFASVLEVNLTNAHRLIQSVGLPMVGRGRGDLVFVTSDVVRSPRPSMGSYVTSKWGLEGYVRALQMELEGTGVRASIVQPGPTMTGMGMDWDPGVTETVIEEWTRWGFARHSHFLRPGAIADAVVFALSAPRGTHIALIEVQPEAPIPKGTI